MLDHGQCNEAKWPYYYVYYHTITIKINKIILWRNHVGYTGFLSASYFFLKNDKSQNLNKCTWLIDKY